MKCQAIILWNTIALVPLFHAACGTGYKLRTGGWSIVVRVWKQCLKRGLSIAAVLSCDDNFKMNPSPPDPVLGEEQRCWWPPLPSTQAPFPSLRQVPSAAGQTASPFLVFLPSHKSAVKCCFSAHVGKIWTSCPRVDETGQWGTQSTNYLVKCSVFAKLSENDAVPS